MASAVRNGADPRLVVPNEYVVARGGIKPISPLGQEFSASVGPDLPAAGCAVLNNQLRVARAGDIRQRGGSVVWAAEYSNRGTLNEQHVNVVECGSTSFSEPMPNPVPKKLRIDEGR
jgi:hypothetical protein